MSVVVNGRKGRANSAEVVEICGDSRTKGDPPIVKSRANKAVPEQASTDPVVRYTGAPIPEVPDILHRRSAGITVWCTGLSGAGKTTLCRAVYMQLFARGIRAEMLDDDEIRIHLSRDLGFTKNDLDENVRRIGFLAGTLTRNGIVALVSAIAPYRASRRAVRRNLVNFLEVYVNAPLEVCTQRDPKGLYRMAREKKLSGLTGVDHPYEPPIAPEVECRTDQESPEESANKVLRAVLNNIFLLAQPSLHRATSGSTARRPGGIHRTSIGDDKKQLTIAVDFDGVIADYDGWKGPGVLGAPRMDVVEALKSLRAEGWTIIVHTTRGSREIRPYLVRNDIPFDEINSNSAYENAGTKPVATVYWDDRAYCYSGCAQNDIEMIRNFRTWCGRR